MKKQAKKNTSSTVGPGGTGYSTGAHQHFAAFGSGEVWYDDEDDEDEFTDEEFDDMMDDFMDEMEDELFEHNQAVWAAKYKELQNKVEALKKAKLGNTGKPKGPSSFGIMAQSGSQPAPARTKQPQAPPPPVVEELSEADKALIDALTLLTELLPAPYGAEPAIYDLLPHSSLGALILMSHVPTVLAQLLRNDSVTDWIARSRVYHAMLGLLKRLADCELTIPTLVGHRPEFSKHPGIGTLMSGQGEFCWQRNEKGEVEMAVPLLEHFKKLKRQAETFLHSAQTQLGGGDGDQEVVEGLSLCADIVGAQDDIRKAMAALHQYNSRIPDTEDEGNDEQATYGPAPSSNAPAESSLGRGKRTKKAAVPRAAALTTTAGKGKGKEKEKATASAENGIHASSFDLEKEYIAACEKLSFDYVTLGSEGPGSSGLVYKTYNFATLLQQTQNSTRIPRNRIHFAKELAVMATSLPPGIWVRVDEVRNDAM
jgi:baculoviral IAP repeat-containing protein 6